MYGELVAIDLETTGLDPDQDAIIEFGAVRIRDGEIIDEYSTLVNPGRPIPDYVKTLTGITDADFLSKPHKAGEPPHPPAPFIAQALPAIRAFVGNATIIGHNINFDLNFLYRQNVFQDNLWLDTYDLAAVLLPRASRYSLGSLSTQMDISLDEAHRALHDARASALLYWALWQKALGLPPGLLNEIVAVSQGLNWSAQPFFEAALQENTAAGNYPKPFDISSCFQPDTTTRQEAVPVPIQQPVSDDEIHNILNNQMPQHMPGYEQRPQQIHMASKITEAFNNTQHIMIEAGTGTGKSLAYLIPSLLWAATNHERVVISTNTINLQDQLISQDIPLLRSTLNVPFEVAVLKGRGNYLCPKNLIGLRQRLPTNLDELRLLAKILVWLTEQGSGDKSELSLRGSIEHYIWGRLSAEGENCGLNRCREHMGSTCPFYKARKAAERADLVIVNHALLVTDAMSDVPVLPEYRCLVADEAHHLEEAITSGLSFRLDETTLQRHLSDLGNSKRGLLGQILQSAQPHIPPSEFSQLTAFIKNIGSAVRAMELHSKTLFDAFRDFYYNSNSYANESTQPLRITTNLRSKSSFASVPEKWATLKEFFEGVSDALKRLISGLGRMKTYPIPDFDDLLNGTNAAARWLEEIKLELTALTQTPDENRIYWLTLGQNDILTIHSAPLHVGPAAEKSLWREKKTIILTSATLQTHDGFDHISQRLQADQFETLNVGSPFDYQTSTLLFIPEDMPDPTDKAQYQQAVERGIIELATALEGRVMALFTSYAQLRQTAQAISPRLALGNITVYDQSDGSSRQNLMEGFKSTNKGVLLGTKSFWEGVDIPGDSLSALVIARLPFAVPTEPIFAARSETYKDSFNEYAVPEAILRFRQGFGRLIRNKTDRGIVTVFDSRILSKSYGARFLEALPDCTIQQGSLQSLPAIALNWIKQ